MDKPMSLHPADLAVSPQNPILMREAPRIGVIERCLMVRPKPFHVVRMYQLLHVVDRHLVNCKIENLFKTCISRDHVVEHIVSPPPKLSCVQGKLQTRLVLLQVLAFYCKAQPGNKDHAGKTRKDEEHEGWQCKQFIVQREARPQ